MPDTAKPREPVSPAHDQGAAEDPSVVSRERKRDEPVVWPRDMAWCSPSSTRRPGSARRASSTTC